MSGAQVATLMGRGSVVASLRESPEAFMASLDELRSRYDMDAAMLTSFMSNSVASALRRRPESFMNGVDTLRDDLQVSSAELSRLMRDSIAARVGYGAYHERVRHYIQAGTSASKSTTLACKDVRAPGRGYWPS